jgi:hypothetical protein
MANSVVITVALVAMIAYADTFPKLIGDRT